MVVELDVDVKTKNLEILDKYSNLFTKNSPLGKKYFRSAKGIVWKHIGQRFRSGGGSRQWAPLKPMTLMLRKHGGSAIMQDSGTLLRSVSGGTGSKSITGTSRLVIGTNVKYARPLNDGATIMIFGRHKANLPARPFMYFDAPMKDELSKALKFHLDNVKAIS